MTLKENYLPIPIRTYTKKSQLIRYPARDKTSSSASEIEFSRIFEN